MTLNQTAMHGFKGSTGVIEASGAELTDSLNSTINGNASRFTLRVSRRSLNELDRFGIFRPHIHSGRIDDRHHVPYELDDQNDDTLTTTLRKSEHRAAHPKRALFTLSTGIILSQGGELRSAHKTWGRRK